MTKTVCEHGKEPTSHIPPGGWAGPSAVCECCRSTFVWLDAGGMNFATGESWAKTWTPRNRCGDCGGVYVETGIRPSRQVLTGKQFGHVHATKLSDGRWSIEVLCREGYSLLSKDEADALAEYLRS